MRDSDLLHNGGSYGDKKALYRKKHTGKNDIRAEGAFGGLRDSVAVGRGLPRAFENFFGRSGYRIRRDTRDDDLTEGIGK